MRFHTFGRRQQPVMLLIHGMLTPWQIWETQISHFQNRFYVIAAALDAHTEEEQSDFVSLEQQAAGIASYLRDAEISDVHTVCGISLGGAIAYTLWEKQVIPIRNLVLDGAPLVSIPKFARWWMTQNYLRIIRNSHKRDKRTIAAFKRDFLPERYLESYLKIADLMTEESIRNIMASLWSCRIRSDVRSDTGILFIHGTRSNEIISKKAAMLLKKYYPETTVICFDGDLHCEKAIYQPEHWIETIENWMQQASS